MNIRKRGAAASPAAPLVEDRSRKRPDGGAVRGAGSSEPRAGSARRPRERAPPGHPASTPTTRRPLPRNAARSRTGSDRPPSRADRSTRRASTTLSSAGSAPRRGRQSASCPGCAPRRDMRREWWVLAEVAGGALSRGRRALPARGPDGAAPLTAPPPASSSSGSSTRGAAGWPLRPLPDGSWSSSGGNSASLTARCSGRAELMMGRVEPPGGRS